MYIGLTYLVTFFVIVISAFVTLFIKYELEQMFREKKDVPAFHICNLIIVLMVSVGAYAVMTLYVAGSDFKLFPNTAILLAVILPIYLIGHLAFEKYKSVYEKYRISEDEKVIVLNEKYLKKKRSARFKEYNAMGKEDRTKRAGASRRRYY
ncbi:hypothetical protein D4T97_005060 [Siminovitchia acidinfaciens]|uniref:Uncharacterized protein n=1 Tax=Siminovitchia acidinfaciens TaxID=2321395 RepID=A0A429Y400_9BACI|nr:hypothetical protein [Siminovitchia acidinfaciens]RST76156.1 hypothetical protein D4T97_005060 [Siminovitchia acidinfaciens]